MAFPSDGSCIELFGKQRELYVGYAKGCKHWSEKDYYNEDNNHVIMVSVDNWFGITFRNSYFDRTVGFGYVFHTPKLEIQHDIDVWIRGNLPVGLIYGYKDRLFGDFTIGTLPAIEFGLGDMSLNVTVFPIVVVMFGFYF